MASGIIVLGTAFAIYVSPIVGSDSNSGSEKCPVRTLDRAIHLANKNGGGTVYLSPGNIPSESATPNELPNCRDDSAGREGE